MELTKLFFLFVLQVNLNDGAYVSKSCGSLEPGRIQSTAVNDGKGTIYYLGGLALPSIDFDEVVKYNISSGESKVVGNFPQGIRLGCAATDGNGDIFHFGGYGGFALSEIYKISPDDPNPVKVNNLPFPTYTMGAAVYGRHSIFLFGGLGSSGRVTDEIYLYDTQENTIELVGHLPIGSYRCKVVPNKDFFFVFCARGDSFRFYPTTFAVDVIDVTGLNYLSATASAVARDQTFIIGNDIVFDRFYLFDHMTEGVQVVNVTGQFTHLIDTTAAYVPETRMLYVHGDGQSQYATDVYCIDLTCPPEGISVEPHPTNCSKFFFCNHGKPTLQECAPGQLFDPEIGECNIASEVDCEMQVEFSNKAGLV